MVLIEPKYGMYLWQKMTGNRPGPVNVKRYDGILRCHEFAAEFKRDYNDAIIRSVSITSTGNKWPPKMFHYDHTWIEYNEKLYMSFSSEFGNNDFNCSQFLQNTEYMYHHDISGFRSMLSTLEQMFPTTTNEIDITRLDSILSELFVNGLTEDAIKLFKKDYTFTIEVT